MKQILTFLILMAAAVVGRAQSGSDIAATIAQQTGCSYACVEQAIATGELTIIRCGEPGGEELCDWPDAPGFIVIIEGKVPGCDGSPDRFFDDKIIVLEDDTYRNPK